MIEQAFRQGLDMVRKAGLPAKGNDIAVLAAHAVFVKRAAGKEDDPLFADQAPLYAKTLILTAFAKAQ